MTLKVAPINHRWQLGDILNERGLLGVAVEVGTHRGEFARDFLSTWHGSLLHCIDPWDNPPGYEEQARLLTGGGLDRGADLRECRRNLRGFIDVGRVELVRQCSPQAAAIYADESLDLVYLDGDHSHQAIALDMRAWWPKIRRGGLLAGHDFICPGEGDGSPDGWGGCIQPAVMDFARERGFDIRLIIENGPETAGQPWSFYMEKL